MRLLARDTDYVKALASWQLSHGADRRDFTRAQWQRFLAWEATGHGVEDARMLLRWSFVVWLVREGRIGSGDR